MAMNYIRNMRWGWGVSYAGKTSLGEEKRGLFVFFLLRAKGSGTPISKAKQGVSENEVVQGTAIWSLTL